jgi:hypothetical protein
MSGFDQPAVLRGEIYCAPWCGRGCTLEAYNSACTAADELIARMGDGWAPHVWENMGWHWSIQKGCVTIRKEGLRYSAWIEPRLESAGRTMVQFIEYADTPEDALGFATQAARTHVARLNHALEDVLA